MKDISQDGILRLIKIIDSNPEVHNLLKYCPYEILKHWKVEDYKKGEFLLEQGRIYDTFYILVKGTVDIYIMSESGKKYSLTLYKAGNLIGEHEIFEKKPFSSFVSGVTDVTLLELPREYFLNWYEYDRNISALITKNLCQQLYNLSTKAGSDNLYSLNTRICRLIIGSVHSTNSMTVSLNREKLSEQMGVTLRSINRSLKYLKERGIIDIFENSILVKDFAALKNEKT